MNILLIPNAILIPDDMQKKFGKVTPAMVPLGNKSMLENIYEQYAGIVDKCYIICHEQSRNVSQFIELKKINIETICLDKVKDLGYTVYKGLEYIIKNNDNINKVYINFADSLIEGDLSNIINSDFLFSAKPAGSDLWTYFTSNNGEINSILDKQKLKEDPNLAIKYNKIFVGTFCLSRPEFYQTLLKDCLLLKNQEIDSFYLALKKYSLTIPIYFRDVDTWYDVGHSETYFKAKSGVAARSFNSIDIDYERGILKKSSKNKQKLIDEIKWYLKLPENIQYLAPRIYKYSLEPNSPYVSMEFYGYHTLHESFLYGELSIIRWREIFKKLLFIIKDMEQYKVTSQRSILEESMKKIYILKTQKRLNELRNNKQFSPFFSDNIIINDVRYNSLDYYLMLLPKLIDDIIIKNYNNNFNIIHGDLCFANILLEDNYNFMRLIDPRGSFGNFDIYGDSNYELAKLLHSLEGKYDFIIEDMFDINVNKTTIKLNIFDKNTYILEIFKEIFSEKLNNILKIRLIESTLFLSMLPLHSDYPKRQFAMLSVGIMLLESVLKEYENENYEVKNGK